MTWPSLEEHTITCKGYIADKEFSSCTCGADSANDMLRRCKEVQLEHLMKDGVCLVCGTDTTFIIDKNTLAKFMETGFRKKKWLYRVENGELWAEAIIQFLEKEKNA